MTVEISLDRTSIIFDHAFSTDRMDDLFKSVIFIWYVLYGANFVRRKAMTILHFLKVLLKLSSRSDALLPILVESLFLGLVRDLNILKSALLLRYLGATAAILSHDLFRWHLRGISTVLL